jgi:hypothetical protein
MVVAALLVAYVAGVLFTLLVMRVVGWPTQLRFRRLGWLAAWAVMRKITRR